MDNIVAEANDVMSPALDFGLPETAQYVQDRRHVNYFPSGSNIYTSATGNKNLKFYITGEDGTYLDLSSIRMFANLQNDDLDERKFLRPLSGLHAFFSRYRCTVGGQLVQDIDQYNRHCELYNSFKSVETRHMDDIESSANPRWDDDWRHKYANGLDQFVRVNNANDDVVRTERQLPTGGDAKDYTDHNKWGKIANRYTRHSVSGIRGGGEYVRLGHSFKDGFLESGYYLPVRYAPLEIEITIVSDAEEPVIKGVNSASATTIGGDRGGAYFTEGDTFILWQLNNIILRAEVVTLDSSVNNNITSHLLQGGSLKIVYPMCHTITQTFNASGTEINMNVVKSASKLNGCFITFYRAQRGNHLVAGKEDNYYLPDNYVNKRFNYFYNPMIISRFNDRGYGATGDDRGFGFADKNYNISWQLQIANKKYPEFESQSLAEHMFFFTSDVKLHEPRPRQLQYYK